MIRSISIFAFFPLLLLGGVSNQVASIVNTCDAHLQSASTVLQLAKNDCENCLSNLDRFHDANPGLIAYAASSNFFYAVTNCSSAIVKIDLALDQINRSRAVLNTLPALADGLVTNIVVVNTNVTIVVTTNSCSDCSSKLDHIIGLVNYDLDLDFETNMQVKENHNAILFAQNQLVDLQRSLSFGLSMISNQLQQVRSEGDAHYSSLSNELAGISNQIDNGSGDSGSGGGSGGSCNCEVWLEQILYVLTQVYYSVEYVKDLLDSWSPHLLDFLEFYNDLQDVIEEYYNLLVRRYKDFDHRLPEALAGMFAETVSKINLVTDRFRLDQHNQAASIQTLLDGIGSGDNPLELSNEGLISLYSAATLDRSYLTQVKIYEALTNSTFGVSNYVDLTWLEDYLLQVQLPYYYTFNDSIKFTPAFLRSGPYSTRPLTSSGFTPAFAISNFFNNLSFSDPSTRLIDYRGWREVQTNWFDRVETLLIALNGGFNYDDDGKVTEQEKQDFEYDVETVSNSFSSIDYHLESLSNRLSEVLSKYSECVEAFQAEINPGSEIEVFAGGTFLGFQIPRMSLSLSSSGTLMMLAEPCRSLFGFVWLALLSISSFWLLFRFVKVVTLVFVRGYALLATFLSPS